MKNKQDRANKRAEEAGSIKKRKWWQKKETVKEETEGSDHSEALRILINRINKCMKNGDNCLVFTSYLNKQGKTYTVKELGRNLAKANYKTLIVDCNVSAPGLSISEETEKLEGLKGVLDFIEAEREKDDKISYSEVIPYIRNTETENLYIIPVKQNISGQYKKYIRQEKIQNLFQLLKDRFEVVLVEAPSFQEFSYAQSIIEASDGYFMLIKSGMVEKKQIHMIKEKIGKMNTKNVGVIFNRFQER